MFATVISSLIFTKQRKTMQLFPENVRHLWNMWELRAMVLISLSLQTILILIGNWRKHSTSNFLRIVLWLSYLSANAVATISLGILSNNQEDSQGDSVHPNYIITAFWAPFLLLHLGGPDTITAYSLEDNELWLRHLLGLVAQVLVAFYVCFRAWSSKALNFLAIPMFIVGIIKFGERAWVLRASSSELFRESMLKNPDPGPNYARYMEEYISKKAEGFRVVPTHFIEASKRAEASPIPQVNGTTQPTILTSYNFFKTFKLLCADLILSFHDIVNSQSFFQNTNYENVFEVIEIELGFMYDLFFTKAVLVYSWLGGILRCVSLSFTVVVFIAFLFVEKQAYKEVDVAITYVLLVGAIVLEIYAVAIILSSDWTKLWLSKLWQSKHKSIMVGVVDYLHKAISSIPLIKNERWSNTVAQCNLITFCLKARPAKCILIHKDLYINEVLEKHRYKDLKVDCKELKDLIYEQLQDRASANLEDCKQLCALRVDEVFEKANCQEELGWTIKEFDQSIILWHIATDICYHSEPNPKSSPSCEASRLLSNYMLYLLLMCPFMLPDGIGQIRFRDTCAETEEFFTERKSITNEENACKMLLKVSTKILPSEVKGDRSKSVLFDACRLAKALQALGDEENGDNGKKKWELMSDVWVEMLCYAANQCRWSDHAQQLRRGGELLTHVWLVMAHLGLTEKLQISEGHVRAKLTVE